MKAANTVGLIAVVFCFFPLLFCGNDYNPYDNFSNAQIHTVSSASYLADNDSIAIFTTETLVVFATVSEKLDFVRLQAPGNMVWTDTTVTSLVSQNDYRFLVSYADTGVQTLTITAQRSNKDALTQTLRFTTYSPLKQNAINKPFGDLCTLQTVAVGNPVNYYWSFGEYKGVEKTIKSPYPVSVDEVITGVRLGATLSGYLWVADPQNIHQSPKTPFLYCFTDLVGPVIESTTKGVRGDTIVTGDSTFEFTIHVYDQSQEQIDSVVLIGGTFDSISADRANYKKVYTGMQVYTSQSPMRIIVKAWDHSGISTTDTFYVYYNATGPKADLVQLILYSPSTDTATTRLNHMPVSIGISNKTHDTISAKIHVNGILYTDTSIGTSSATMTRDIQLVPGYNIVTMTASASLTTYAETTIVINQNILATDTAKPVFVLYSADNQTVSPASATPYFETTRRSVVFGVSVLDAGSGIASVTANGISLTAIDGAKYTWVTTSLPLLHGYTGIVVAAQDASGNSMMDTLLSISNNLPVIAEPASYPPILYVNKLFSDTIVVADADNDTAKLMLASAPAGMTLTPIDFHKWRISYTPTDTGSSTVIFSLRDSFATRPTLYPWSFKVIQDASLLVRFITTPDSFPRYLEAGKDTMLVYLRVASGYPPYSFAANFIGQTKQLIDRNTLVALKLTKFKWVPAVGDTGLKQLFVTVKDNSGVLDTIIPYPSITVVPKNFYPCTLSMAKNPNVNVQGVLHMSMALKPDTLHFSIYDKDHPYTEQYTVSVIQGNVTTQPTLDYQKQFNVIVTPTTVKEKDTLLVLVSDKSGGKDTIMIPVVYTIPIPGELPNLFMWNSGDAATVTVSAPSGNGQNPNSSNVTKWTPAIPSAVVSLVRNQYMDSMPTFTPAISGTFPSVHFTRSRHANLLDMNNGTWPSRPFTAFFVARLDTVAKDSCYTLLSSCADEGAGMALGVVKGGTFGIYSQKTSIESKGTQFGPSPHKWFLVSYVSPGIVSSTDQAPMMSIWANNQKDSTIALTGATSGSYMLLGATGKHVATSGWDGDIAEAVMYSRVLTTSEWLLVYAHLASKYKSILQ